MKYSNQWVIDNNKSDFLFFWGNDKERPYSQWYPSPFTVGSNKFYTAEHFMMYMKAMIFHDEESAQDILKTPHPDAVKRIGKLVKNFDNQVWDRVKFGIVRTGNIHKFSLEGFQDKLLATKDKVLVEASPYDKIWGIGMGVDDEYVRDPHQWKGENLLGYAIMEARDAILATL